MLDSFKSCFSHAIITAFLFVIDRPQHSKGMKTTVPDEIIEIVNSKTYNRHHLPSQAEAMNRYVPYQRNLGDQNWRLEMEFQPHSFKSALVLTQFKKENKVAKLSFDMRGTEKLLGELILTKDKFKSYGMKVEAKAEEGVDKQILYAFHIRLEPIQKYDGELVLVPDGIRLELTQLRASQRKTIYFPIRFLNNTIRNIQEAIRRANTPVEEYPTNVSIGIYIEGMSSFRAQSMDFHIDIYFSEEWTDRRLAHSSEEPVLIKDLNIYDMLWHPDLYFANAKESKFHSVTSPNFMVWVYNNGTVNLDTRISLVVNCMMDLKNYPLDDQQCYLRILSYAYDIENLNISWKQKDILLNPDIRLPDMQLKNYRADYCPPVIYDAGTWACVRAVFQMDREVMHHVLQSYIPSALIVIISWFSFWLDVDAVPGRVSLCITTLLTLATQSSAARMALPQGGGMMTLMFNEEEAEHSFSDNEENNIEVSYAKAIDVWMGTCMAFVFGVMIEFTAVNYLARFSLPEHPGYNPEEEEGNGGRGGSRGGFPSGGLRRRLRPKPTRTTSSIEFHDLLFDPSDCELPSKHKPYQDPRINGLSPTSLPSALDRQNSDKISAVSFSGTDIEQKRRQNHAKASRVDRICRIGFPLTFIIFNLVYWPYYITAESSHTMRGD